jgi:hypothetical protein
VSVGGFVFSGRELAQAIARSSRLEGARMRFAPAQTADLTMRDLEGLIGQADLDYN